MGIEVTWNEEDVRSRFANSGSNEFDMSNFVEYLAQRQRRLGCVYKMQCKATGEPERIFVQLDDSFKEWAATEDNVLLFDPTWGTNRYGMKLCCFTTVSSTGQTVILAFAVLSTEGRDDILWAFRCFSDIFIAAPSALFTDDGSTITLAFRRMQELGLWSKTRHMLCIYHLAKNFFKHFKPHFPDKLQWHHVNSWCWLFAKCADNLFPIDVEWEHFRSFVESNGVA